MDQEKSKLVAEKITADEEAALNLSIVLVSLDNNPTLLFSLEGT